MLLYQDDRFLDHHTGSHPECAERLRRIHAHLRNQAAFSRCERLGWTNAPVEHIALVHDGDYVEQLRQFAAAGGGRIETDTIISPASFQVALRASGAICDAVGRVVHGPDPRALCLVRPPGHHAVANHAMGFCLFNHVAIAARLAVDQFELDRVLIVDWDVHHGNGTQDAFWEDEQVGFFSIHRWPFYPGSGRAWETGSGPGLGTTFNLPVKFGTPRREYLARFTAELTQFAEKMKPQLVLLSAGFDAHRADPIGSLGLEVEDYLTLSRAVIATAQQHADGRLVSTLEGGYNVDVLPLCVAAHLEALTAAETDDAAID